MAGFFLLALLSIVGSSTTDGYCDMVEVNHYTPEGSVGFVQLIAWDWSPEYRRWHAQQWLILVDWSRRGDVVSCNGDGIQLRIRSRLFRETWTQHDPERQNQVLFPTNERRKVW